MTQFHEKKYISLNYIRILPNDILNISVLGLRMIQDELLDTYTILTLQISHNCSIKYL